MNDRLHQLRAFINYWLDAVSHHALHSPFLYEFYTQVLHDKTSSEYPYAEIRRKVLLANSQSITVKDYGGGSAFTQRAMRSVSSIAHRALTPAKYASLYQRIIQHYEYKEVLELGTSLGVNTLYLAQGGTRVTTLEGSPALCALAEEGFTEAGKDNIRVVTGNIDDMLPALLKESPIYHFAFIDANHQYMPTMRYVNWLLPFMAPMSSIIIDDIHRSGEMERAWNEIKSRPAITCTIDLFRCGIAFINESLTRQHVVLQY